MENTCFLKPKNVLGLLVMSILLIMQVDLVAQCGFDNVDSGITLNTGGTVGGSDMGDIAGGEYLTIEVCYGGQYSFSTCGQPNPFDTELTLYNADGSTQLDYNDDGCTDPLTGSIINFTSAIDGTLLLLLDEVSCMDNAALQTIVVKQTGGCQTNTCGTCSTGIAPDNDICDNSVDLGTLSAGGSCAGAGTGVGISDVFADFTNVCSTAENPYVSILNCQLGGDMASPAASVWFSFVVTDPILTIDLTSSLVNANVGLWLDAGGGCGSLTPVGCAQSSTGSFTEDFQPLSAGTYYLQVSGSNILDQCDDIDITLTNSINCGACIQASEITLDPPPLDGQYNQGDVVEVCFEVLEYNQEAANWFHGIEAQFGPGWDVSTLVPGTPPAACASGATWSWYTSVVGEATGDTQGPGFFVETGSGNGGTVDGDPGNNYGDADLFDGTGANCTLTFCWSIMVDDSGACTDGADLSISFDTFSDYETGSWTSQGCTDDFEPISLQTLACCDVTIAPFNIVDCTAGTIELKSDAVYNPGNTIDFIWSGPSGYASTDEDPSDATLAGTYLVTVTDVDAGCSATGFTEVILDIPPAPIAMGYDICIGDPLQDIVSTGTGNAGAEFNWYDGDPSVGGLVPVVVMNATFSSADQTANSVLNSTANSYDFWVTETSDSGCEGAATQITINVTDCSCPAADNAVTNQLFCGNDAAIDLSDGGATGLLITSTTHLNTDDADGDGIDWFSTATPTIGDTPYVPGTTVPADQCSEGTVTLYAFLRCDLDDLGFDGIAGDSYEAVGSITVTVYPTITMADVTETPDCALEVVSTCADPSNINVWYEDAPAGSGTYSAAALPVGTGTGGAIESGDTWNYIVFYNGSEVIDADANGISDCAYQGTLVAENCAACPMIIAPAPDVTLDICHDSALDLATDAEPSILAGITDDDATATDADADGNADISWFTDIALTIPYDGSNITHSGLDICTPETVTLYAAIECSIDATVNPIAAGTYTLTVYPDMSTWTVIIMDDGACGPYVDSYDCEGTPGFGVSNDYDATTTTTPDYSTETATGNVDFTVTNSNAPTTCNTYVEPTSFNCTTCPAVTTLASGSFQLCGDDLAIDLVGMEASIVIDAAVAPIENDGIEFYLTPPATPGDSPTDPYTPGSLIADITVSCDPVTATVYAYYLCDLLGDDSTIDYVTAGSFDITVYPDLVALNIVVMDDGTCAPYVDSYDCEGSADYSIENNYDGNGATPDFTGETATGTVIFIVNSSTAPLTCNSTTTGASYNCTTCPAVTTPASGTFPFCGDDSTMDIAGLEASIIIDAAVAPIENDGIEFYLTPPVTPGDPPMDPYTTGNLIADITVSCDAVTATVYAYYLCDLLGDDSTIDYVSAGTFDIEVYPDLSALNIVVMDDGACGPYVDSYDCEGATGFSISNDYDANGSTPDFSLENSVGPVNFTVSNSAAPVTCQDSTPASANFNCGSCPAVTSTAMGSTDYCGDDSGVDLSAIEAMIVYDAAISPVAISGIEYYLTPPATAGDAPTDAYTVGNIIGDISVSCDPITTTIYAYVVCDLLGDGSVINYLDGGSFDVVVYPDLSALNIVVMDDGACGPYVESYDCEGNSTYSIANDYDGNITNPDFSTETMSGDVIFTVSNSAALTAGVACSEVTTTAEYVCAPDCPSEPSISADAVEFCGDGTITITGVFAVEPSPGTFDIASVDGLVATSSGVFDLPTNETCDIIQYIFIATATCDEDASDIAPLDPLDMTIEVNVYPAPFTVLETEGSCGNPGLVSIQSVAGTECDSDLGLTPPNPNCGTGDISSEPLIYQNTFFAGTICEQSFDLSIAADCGPLDCTPCPSTLDTPTTEELCSGEAPNLPTLTLENDNGVSVEWFDGDPDAGANALSFIDFENESCSPSTITLYAYILCDDDEDLATPDVYWDLLYTHTVTLYPAPFSLSPTEGGCETAPIMVVLAANGLACDEEEGIAPATPLCETDAIESPLDYVNVFFAGTICEQALAETVPATCEALPCGDCPSTADANTSEEVCSGESPVLPTLTLADDNLNAVEWFEGDAATGTPFANINFANETCDPTDIIISAYILCDDDGNPATPDIYWDLAYDHTVTLYPAPFTLSPTEGACEMAPNMSVLAVNGDECDNEDGTAPATPLCDTAPIESPLDYVNVFFAGTICEQALAETVPATCEALPCGDCPSTADANTSEEVCSGGSPILPTLTLADDNLNAVEWFEGDAATGTPFGSINFTNESCDPTDIIISAYILCDDDGNPATPDVYWDLAYDHTVTLYPTAFVLTTVEGDCAAATIVVNAVNGEECDSAIGEDPIPPSCDLGGTTDSPLNYDNIFFDGSACSQIFNEVVNASCTTPPPPDCNDDDCTTDDSFDGVDCECVNVPIPPLDCNDNDCLTADVYNIQTCECENNPIEPGACDDGDCTTEDVYDVDLCDCVFTPLPPPVCDDNDCTTDDSYDTLTCECVFDAIEPPVCDDNDCTTEDTYDTSICECVFSPVDPPLCDDNDCNTADSYDTSICECVFDAIEPPVCDDGDCTTDDNYNSTTCECEYTPVEPLDCDDDDCGTADSYDTANCECINDPIEPLDCDDGDCGTVDSYDAATCSCINDPIPPPDCNDDDCTTDDSYNSATCECEYTPVEPLDCDDGDCLTADVYNIQTCECENNLIEPGACDDGDCTTEDEYDVDLCECVYTPLPPPVCDDNDCNTTDDYDSLTCECVFTPVEPPLCDDGDCGTVDSYDAATCECVYDPVEPLNCDDGDCGTVDSYDAATCSCINDPIPPPDCNDDDCTTDDSYNSTTCECEYSPVEPLDCDDGDCLTADVYNIQTCECENNPIEPGACDDGDCTTEDAYDEALCECVYTPLPPPVCDDNDCNTTDDYDSLTCECVYTPIPEPDCDDGDCGTVDSYDAATCECVYDPVEPLNCDDGDCGTADSYDAATCSCINDPLPEPDCNDDDCTTDDSYNGATCECEYTPVEPLNCDDNDCLTADVYNIQTCECENNPIEPGACDDGDCTTEDAYDVDLCECVYTPLPPPVCDDNDCNTTDDYDSLTCECVYTPIPEPDCDDGDCSTIDSYDASTCECVYGIVEPGLCDDNDCNTADSYDFTLCECVYTAIPEPDCNDNDCTTDDTYNSTSCECEYTPIAPLDCDDNDCLTADVYNIQTCECENNPIEPGACDDGDCTTEDAYDEDLCECVYTPLPPPVCDDNDCNTTDDYDSLTCECVFTPVEPPVCDDGDCGTVDSYDATICECVYEAVEPGLCDDGDCNTADTYDTNLCECVYTAIPEPDCNDNDCTTDDSYNNATCECEYTPVEPLNCDDGDCLTADVYNIQTCECENNPIEPGACDDGDCTTEDVYDEDLCECVYTDLPEPECDDLDCTTEDSYNTETCECINDPIEPPVCDDDDCGTVDSYNTVTCECVYEAVEPGLCDDNDCNTEDAYDETLCECVYTPIPEPDCNDDDCTTDDSYNSTTCECEYSPVEPLDCDDGDCLTADVYNIQTCECENNPIEPGACDDGNCTTEDVYDEDLCECVYTDLPEPECDDLDCTTEDSYNTETCDCVFTPIEPPVCDDLDCTTEDTYDETLCECVFTPVEPPVCDDLDCTTTDTYDETLCECVFTPIEPPVCDDEDCTTEDTYDTDTCECVFTPIPPPDCNDDDCNTADVFNIQTCECENNPIEPGACDDGDCTTEDSYDLDLCECVNEPITPPDCNDNDCTTTDDYDSLTCDCINDPIDPMVDATIDQSVVCDGDDVTLSLSANADLGANLEWTLPDGNTITGGALTYTAISVDPCGETQTISYTVSCPDTGNLIDLGSFEITIYPEITATATDGICSASITSDCPNFIATWDAGDGTSGEGFEYVADLGNTGTVTFIVSNSDAPAACNEAIFTANYDCPFECTDLDASTIAPTTDLCNDEGGFGLNSLISPTATPGGVWSSPDAPEAINGNNFNPSEVSAGVYTIVYTVNPPITDPDICLPTSTSQTIEVVQAPSAEVGFGMNVCNDSTEGNTIVNFNTLVSNASGTGVWTDVSNSGASGSFPEFDFEGLSEGVYQFIYTVSADEPCVEVSYPVSITVEDCSFKIAFPNAFSPNNDGINDGFGPISNRIIEEYQMFIYDRWGVLIFSTNDANTQWDGTYKGEVVDLGVYVFYTSIKVEGEEDARVYKGNVTVMR